MQAAKSITSLLLWSLAGLICLSGSMDTADGETIRIGNGGQNSWQDGGGEFEPIFVAGPKVVGTGNTPGGVIDFTYINEAGESREGWMFPTSADVTENIALGLLGRGGAVTAPTVLENIQTELETMIDDKGSTAFERKSTELKQVNALGVVVQFDLGSRFGVSRVKFFPRNADPDYLSPDTPFQDDFLKAYEILLNDGTRETTSGGLPVFTSIILEPQNTDAVVDLRIEPQYVRFLRVRSESTVGFEIAEVQVFGEGFVPVAAYISDIYDRSTNLALWGNIRWEEESIGDPFRSRVEISTRTGLDDTPLVFNRLRVDTDQEEVLWKKPEDFDEGTVDRNLLAQLDGSELSAREARIQFNALSLERRNALSLTQDDYRELRDAEKGAVQEDIVNWSLWTPPYPSAGRVTAEQMAANEGGTRILSPGPRRFFQFKMDYASEELFSAKGTSSLSFDFASPALAEEIVAEILPRETALGELTEFSYTFIPNTRPGVDQGFRSFEISTPVQVSSIGKIELTRASGDVLEEDFSQVDLASLTGPVTLGEFSVDSVAVDLFRISFPEIGPSRLEGQVATLDVGFKGVVLRTGTAFTGRALPEDPEGLSQKVIGGNAGAVSQGSSLVRDPARIVVQVPIKGKLLINASAVPNILTPNGDGINDLAQINYDVTSLIGGAEVTVRIHDLSGQLVKEVYAGSDKSGRYARPWDGTDVSGTTVPPGIYIFRMEVNADSGDEETSGTIAVAY